MKVFLIMAVCGLLTFLTRLSFIAAEGRLTPPSWFRDALPYVPVAALTALIVPDLLVDGGRMHLVGNPRLYAGAVAIFTAWRFRNPTLTIAVGFITLFALNAMRH